MKIKMVDGKAKKIEFQRAFILVRRYGQNWMNDANIWFEPEMAIEELKANPGDDHRLIEVQLPVLMPDNNEEE